MILIPLAGYLVLNSERNNLRAQVIKNVSNKDVSNLIAYGQPSIYAINYDETLVKGSNFIIQRYNLQKYFAALSIAVSKAVKSIYILDYVAHGSAMEDNSPFSAELRIAYDLYFKAIEDVVISNPNINYVRVLQIPLGVNVEFESEIEILKYSLNNLYSPARKHISNLIDAPNFKFFVLSKAIRSISEIIIDENVWFIEIDKYEVSGISRPDRLLSYNKNNEQNGLFEDEVRLINKVLKKHTPVTREQLVDTVKLLQEDLNRIASSIENNRRELAKDFEDV